MKHAVKVLLVMACISSVGLMSVQANASEGPVSVYSKAVKLTPGTSDYAIWAAWIRSHSNYRYSYANGQLVKTPVNTDVGDVTITESTVQKSGSADTFNQGVGPLDNPAPPTPLPQTGYPGEKLTVTNATRFEYQSWTFEWLTSQNNGAGGWLQINYTEHLCIGDVAAKNGVNPQDSGPVNCAPGN